MIRKFLAGAGVAGLALVGVVGGGATANAAAPDCWGQASAVFAQTGELGSHSAAQPTPRVGLRNLARDLADAGVIPDDSMASLGAFVANELNLSIDACE